MLVAQKVWDDEPLKNAAFTMAWGCVCKNSEAVLSTKTINAMEASFLTALQFDLFVSSKAYLSTFIEICALAPTQGLTERLHHVKTSGHAGEVLQSLIFDRSLGPKPRNTDYDEWSGVHSGPDGKGIAPPDAEAERPPMRKWKSIDVTGWER